MRQLGNAVIQFDQEMTQMADNKKVRSKADRMKVARSETYEVAYFARKHGITTAETKALIQKLGNNREKLNNAATSLSRAKKGGYTTAGVTRDGVVILGKSKRSKHFTTKGLSSNSAESKKAK